MYNEELLHKKLRFALQKIDIDVKEDFIIIEAAKDKIHGDYASNIAMKLASKLKTNPRALAQQIIDSIDKEGLDKIEIAGPGFINFFMSNEILSNVIDRVLNTNDSFGTGDKKTGKLINLEYVSANPTGDLHLGHARGAAIGDSLARILKKAGYSVIREYYVNDAGAQILHLGESLKARYFELYDKKYDLPEDGYQGEDIIEIAKQFKSKYGDKYLEESDENIEIFKEFGMEKELDKLKNDLNEFRVNFDVFSFETTIRQGNVLTNLANTMKDYIYKKDGATYLATSKFVDDKDRVIIKSNGEATYFWPDIAYHLNKLSRKATNLIDVLGADHHGYINRMKSALMMNGYREESLEVELIQMVRIVKDGEEVKMSKRLGNAIKLRDLVQEVGIDAVRYFFVSRDAATHLDFDLELALSQSSSNPVFYAQYAYARMNNVLSLSTIPLNDKYNLLIDETEFSLMKSLSEYDKIVQDAAKERAPYKICNYIQKLSGYVHEFYAKCRILDVNNVDLTGARLSLIKACSIVIKNALELIGVSAPEKM
ncbi:MAG: arginine--tRNA ligase [Bacilli bacterium]